MTTTTLSIVGMPYIDIAAVRRRSTSALAIWYVGRVLAVDGVVRIADLEHHFPRQSLDRLLTDGTGTFWASNHLKRGVLFLRSAARVTVALGVPRISAQYVAPVEFVTRTRNRRARLALNAFAHLRRGRPISAAAIAAACGVSRRTVFAWMRATRWPRTRNHTPWRLFRPRHGGMRDAMDCTRVARIARETAPWMRIVARADGLHARDQEASTLRRTTLTTTNGNAVRRITRRIISSHAKAAVGTGGPLSPGPPLAPVALPSRGR